MKRQLKVVSFLFSDYEVTYTPIGKIGRKTQYKVLVFSLDGIPLYRYHVTHIPCKTNAELLIKE